MNGSKDRGSHPKYTLFDALGQTGIHSYEETFVAIQTQEDFLLYFFSIYSSKGHKQSHKGQFMELSEYAS